MKNHCRTLEGDGRQRTIVAQGNMRRDFEQSSKQSLRCSGIDRELYREHFRTVYNFGVRFPETSKIGFMAILPALHDKDRKRGNPNWGRPSPLA
jgi:hypothetical protein